MSYDINDVGSVFHHRMTDAPEARAGRGLILVIFLIIGLLYIYDYTLAS